MGRVSRGAGSTFFCKKNDAKTKHKGGGVACLREILYYWLTQEADEVTPAGPTQRTLEEIVEALQSNTLEESALAENLKQNFCKGESLKLTRTSSEPAVMGLSSSHSPFDGPKPNRSKSLGQKLSAEGRKCALNWTLKNKAPHRMSSPSGSGAAVVHDQTAYMRPYRKTTIYSYYKPKDEWKKLIECKVEDTSLIILPVTQLQDGQVLESFDLHTIGGALDTEDGLKCTNNLYQLTQIQGEYRWVDSQYSPMTLKRKQVTAVFTDKYLIVVGGRGDLEQKDPTIGKAVEILDITSDQKIWQKAADLPHSLYRASVCICNEFLYVMGGWCIGDGDAEKPIRKSYKAAIKDLLQSDASISSDRVFKKIAELRLVDSACVSICGKVLAIGGSQYDHVRNEHLSSSRVYEYSEEDDAWKQVNDSMTVDRCFCFAMAFTSKSSKPSLMVVGGCSRRRDDKSKDSFEIANLEFS